MLPTDTRCFTHHAQGLFTSAALDQVREHFLRKEQDQWQASSQREQTRLAIGSAPDDFRLDHAWYECWRDVDPFIMAPFTMLLYPVAIRHVAEEAHLVPWHQDFAYVALMPRKHARVVTCFVPLEPDTKDRSTLEFATGEWPLLPHTALGGHGAAIQRSFAKTQRHDLLYGDAVIFGDHTPHRTVPGRGGVIDRRSFEFRATTPADVLSGKDYFDLTTKKFIRTE
jgi:hypothetical protein